MTDTLTKDWAIQPNEAFDMILLLNAVSQNDFYRRHYQGVREHYVTKLGERGMNLVDQAVNCLSMSALCKLLSYLKVNTINDIIHCLRNFEYTYTTIKLNLDANNLEDGHMKQSLDNLAINKGLFLECFDSIQQAKIDENWRNNIQPHIHNVAGQLSKTISVLYPYHQIRSMLSSFLGYHLSSRPYQVYLATYIKPIAFQLSKQAMVTHQGPPGYMPLPKEIACLCIHETIHRFPGSELAQIEQEKLRMKNETFNRKFLELINHWQSGPEEFFVVGAEAYLTETLKIRTHEECLQYLKNQNNGMPFSLEIYKKLREERPDHRIDWLGYGDWLTNTMKSDEFCIKALG
jgi:hypothetical protein